MSAKARKRSRPLSDEHRADCPFTATILKEAPQDIGHGHRSKKRKHHEGHGSGNSNGIEIGHDEERSKVLVQNSPFHPAGKFKTNDFMRIGYNVEPWGNWLGMTRYNSFVLNGVKYFTDDFVYVANDRTVERHKQPTTTKDEDDDDNDSSGSGSGGSSSRRRSRSSRRASEYWVARILEVRASDEHHVYARVYWMYWPDELPAGTLDGKKTSAGRQPYHGRHELIASNHMDVINVVSVAMAASVKQWVETDDDEIQDTLYWRQAFDCRTSQFSNIELVCRCMAPANPDKALIGCTNVKCEKWMHYECLLDDVLTRVYRALGTDTPFKTEKAITVKHEDEDKGTTTKIPTPTKVKDEESGSPSYAQNQVVVKQTTNGATRASTPTTTPTTTTTAAAAAATTPQPPPLFSDQSGDKFSRLSITSRDPSRRSRKTAGKKPYDGLFEATLRTNQGPTMWQVVDKRPNVLGGDKMWTEKAYCLLCGSVLD